MGGGGRERDTFLLQIHLNPVSVSSKRKPSVSASARVILDDTVLATTCTKKDPEQFGGLGV